MKYKTKVIEVFNGVSKKTMQFKKFENTNQINLIKKTIKTEF